eukprot:gene7280-9922_t
MIDPADDNDRSKKGRKPKFVGASDKARTIYGHIDRVISNNLSFRSVEYPTERLYTTLPEITRQLLVKYIIALSNEVCEKIKSELPDKFGLLLDGWKGNDKVFYIGLYAVYYVVDLEKNNGEKLFRRVLLSIMPPIYESDHSAWSHSESIKSTLEWYGKTTECVLYVVSDNCATMRCMTRDHLLVPFIGCYAHKLNLAIKFWLGIHIADKSSPAYASRSEDQKDRERLVSIVHDVCVAARNVLSSARQREVMGDDFVSIILDQETRWTSVFSMIKRFVRIEGDLWASRDRTVTSKMPDNRDLAKIKELLKLLESLNKYMVKIQERDINLADARGLFDSVLTAFPSMQNYLGDDAALIVDENFDNGVVKVLNGNQTSLTIAETEAIKRFKIVVPHPNNINAAADQADVDDGDLLNPNKVLEESRKRQKLGRNSSEVYDIDAMSLIPATSCGAERLFSSCGIVQGKLHCAMTSKTFECRMILHQNDSYWKNERYQVVKPGKKNIRYGSIIKNQGYRMIQNIINSAKIVVRVDFQGNLAHKNNEEEKKSEEEEEENPALRGEIIENIDESLDYEP